MGDKSISTGGAIAFVIGVIVVLLLIMTVSSWECLSNKHCQEGYYCSSSHECQLYPEIGNVEIVVEHNYVVAALILGLSMIAAVYVYKKTR